MRAVLQRVSHASVEVEHSIVGEIGLGCLVLLAIAPDDSEEDVQWISRRLASLKIFCDTEGKMSKSLLDVGGQLLLVSQFTLLADLKKGTRPSFHRSAKPQFAEPWVSAVQTCLSDQYGIEVETGRFGASMQVSLLNDGPVTLILDSHQRDF